MLFKKLKKHKFELMTLVLFLLLIATIKSYMIVFTFVHALYGLHKIKSSSNDMYLRICFLPVFVLEALATTMLAGVPILKSYWEYIFIGAAAMIHAASISVFDEKSKEEDTASVISISM